VTFFNRTLVSPGRLQNPGTSPWNMPYPFNALRQSGSTRHPLATTFKEDLGLRLPDPYGWRSAMMLLPRSRARILDWDACSIKLRTSGIYRTHFEIRAITCLLFESPRIFQIQLVDARLLSPYVEQGLS